MILLELELETPKKNLPPFTLLLQSNTLGPEWKTDASLCVQLARVSDEWSVSVCSVDNVRHLHKFEVSRTETFQKDDLIRLAKQIKEQQMAVRAAALARGPGQSKKTESQEATETGAQKCFQVAWQRRFLWRRGAA